MKDTMESHLRKTITLVDKEIKIRQDELSQLTTTRKSLVELAGDDEAAVQEEETVVQPKKLKRGPYKAKVKPAAPKKPAKVEVVSTSSEVPESLGAAMKLVGKALGKFTSDKLREEVKAKYKELFEEVGPGAFGANLKYWTSKGYLTLVEDVYTVENLDF